MTDKPNAGRFAPLFYFPQIFTKHTDCVLQFQPIELSFLHQTREPQTRKRTMTRTENLKRLFNVMLEIYTNRKDSHPSVAAQFHVEGFVTDHRRDAYFDSLLEMEIEDCSRSLVIA